MKLLKKIILTITCLSLLIPNLVLAASHDQVDSCIINFNNAEYKIDIIKISEYKFINRIINLSTNETIETTIDIESNLLSLDNSQFLILEENEPLLIPYSICTPGQSMTRKKTISLFDVKQDDKLHKGYANDMVFLSLLTAVLLKVNPIAGAVSALISDNISGNNISSLYDSYKNKEYNIRVTATYHYRCVEIYDYDPGFDYNGGSYVPIWELASISW